MIKRLSIYRLVTSSCFCSFFDDTRKVFQFLQSKGPLFFTQERVGLGGSKFTILKFRSMEYEEKTEHQEAKQAVKDDPRVFPLGGFMRRFSLDEFPQFINVLRGEMSLVGPRPYLTKHDYLFQQISRLTR